MHNVTDPLLTSKEARTQRTVRILAGFLGITAFIAVVAIGFLIFYYIRQRRLPPKRRPGEYSPIQTIHKCDMCEN